MGGLITYAADDLAPGRDGHRGTNAAQLVRPRDFGGTKSRRHGWLATWRATLRVVSSHWPEPSSAG